MNTFRKNALGPMLFVALVAMTSCRDGKKSMQEAVEAVPEILTLEAQIDEIMSIWPGTYNNDKQVADLAAKGEDIWRVDNSGEHGYLHLQSHYIKLDKPDIGEDVLYVEEYRDHQPDAIYRQRIYTIFEKDSIIRVKMYPFKDKKKYIGAWKNISLLDSLTLEEITAFPDICDLIVKKVDDKYDMKMNVKDCAFGDRVFNYEVILSKNMFTYRDKITTLNDSLISTAANFAYHNLDRIQ